MEYKITHVFDTGEKIVEVTQRDVNESCAKVHQITDHFKNKTDEEMTGPDCEPQTEIAGER